jgi:hypothetical protein
LPRAIEKTTPVQAQKRHIRAPRAQAYLTEKRMLVRFNSKVGMITMFGDVATKLLRTMGQSGAVPGALLAPDIPAAVQRLRQGVSAQQAPEETGQREAESDRENEERVSLSQRAFPLIELLERASKNGSDVIWEEESKAL